MHAIIPQAHRAVTPEIVRQTPVVTDTVQLTVSTVRIGRGHYDTVVFDDSVDRRHSGQRLAGFVIDHSSKPAATREAAMDHHREAVHAARTETVPTNLPAVELRHLLDGLDAAWARLAVEHPESCATPGESAVGGEGR